MISHARKPKFLFCWLSFLTIAMLTQAPPLSAQSAVFDTPSDLFRGNRTGAISGTVYLNRSAQPAPQVIVNIQSLSSGLNQSVLTDLAGHFEFKELPLGAYEVSAGERGSGFVSTITQVDPFSSELTLYLNSSSPPPAGNSFTVSVHELKIPEKAQNEYLRGLNLIAKGDFAGSLTHLNKATAAYVDYYEAFYHIGIAELRLGDEDKAMEAFQKSIDLSGGRYARPQFAYGLLLCKQGKPEEGERLIRRGLETDADSAEGHLFLALSLFDQNRLEDAEKSVREALLRKPQYVDAFLVLSDIHAKRGDYQSQVEDLDIYLRLAPTAPGNEAVRRVRDVAKRHISESSLQN